MTDKTVQTSRDMKTLDKTKHGRQDMTKQKMMWQMLNKTAASELHLKPNDINHSQGKSRPKKEMVLLS